MNRSLHMHRMLIHVCLIIADLYGQFPRLCLSTENPVKKANASPYPPVSKERRGTERELAVGL